MAIDNVYQLRTEQTLNKLDNSIQSLASKLNTLGQVLAVGAIGYGAYSLMTSKHPAAQGVRGFASSAAINTRDAVGLSPVGQTYHNGMVFNSGVAGLMGSPANYSGRNMMAVDATYYGQRDFAQRASASVSSFAATAASMGLLAGGGAIFNSLGISPMISGALGRAGSTLGSGILGGGISMAGRGLGGILGGLGMGSLGGAVSKGAGWMAGGAAKIGGLAGGLVGSFAAPIAAAMIVQKGADAVIQNVAAQRRIEDMAESIGYMITPGMASNIATGRGLNYKDQANIAKRARDKLINETYMRQSDFTDIFQGMVEGDLLYNVRGAEEFSDKFNKVVDSVKKISRIYRTTLKQSTDLLGEMQRSGFYTIGEQTQALLANDIIGRYTGYTGAQVHQMGQTGSQVTQSYGLGAQTGYNIATNTLLATRLAERGMSDNQRQSFLELIQEMGGDQGAIEQTTQFVTGLMKGNDMFKRLMYYAYDQKTGQVDNKVFRDITSGKYSLDELLSRADSKIAKNAVSWQDFLNNSDAYWKDFSGDQLLKLTDAFTKALSDTSGKSMAQILSELGATNVHLRQYLEKVLPVSNKISQGAIQIDASTLMAVDESTRGRTLGGITEKYIKNPLEKVGSAIASPFVSLHEGFMGFTENFWNKWVRQAKNYFLDFDTLSIDNFGKVSNPDVGAQGVEDTLIMQMYGISKEDLNWRKQVGGGTFDFDVLSHELVGAFASNDFRDILKAIVSGKLSDKEKKELISKLPKSQQTLIEKFMWKTNHDTKLNKDQLLKLIDDVGGMSENVSAAQATKLINEKFRIGGLFFDEAGEQDAVKTINQFLNAPGSYMDRISILQRSGSFIETLRGYQNDTLADLLEFGKRGFEVKTGPQRKSLIDEAKSKGYLNDAAYQTLNKNLEKSDFSKLMSRYMGEALIKEQLKEGSNVFNFGVSDEEYRKQFKDQLDEFFKNNTKAISKLDSTINNELTPALQDIKTTANILRNDYITNKTRNPYGLS